MKCRLGLSRSGVGPEILRWGGCCWSQAIPVGEATYNQLWALPMCPRLLRRAWNVGCLPQANGWLHKVAQPPCGAYMMIPLSSPVIWLKLTCGQRIRYSGKTLCACPRGTRPLFFLSLEMQALLVTVSLPLQNPKAPLWKGNTVTGRSSPFTRGPASGGIRTTPWTVVTSNVF